MNQQERAQVLWAVSFVISGVVFILAFMFSPLIGTLVTLSYIMLYVGLSAVFLIVFREIEKLKKGALNELIENKKEIEEMKRAIEKKYYKKRIDESTYKDIIQDYEKKLTEIEVKINRLKKKK